MKLSVNPWLENISDIKISKIYSLDTSTDKTQEYVTWILHKNSSSVVKNAILNNSENFKKYILEYISTHQAITNGQEWEIHKIEVDNKKFIVAKKRYDVKSKNEFILQKEAYKVSKESDSWVCVPEPIYEFDDWTNWYIVMEYIDWKTLYTKTWEWIINQHVIPYLEKHIMHEKKDYMPAELDLYELLKKYWNNWVVSFLNDTQAEEWVIEFLEILYKLGVIDDNPNHNTKDINNPQVRKNIALEKYYKKHIWKTIVFNRDKWQKIWKMIQQFITDLHDSWIYHRDLWWNPRNIMFTDDKVYIIDFWKSQMWVTQWWYSNVDQITWWIYDDDESIVQKIKQLSWVIKNNYSEINNNTNHEQIIANWKKLWLNISKNNVKLYASQMQSINIERYIDDLVNNNDNSYNWFIYLSEKWNDREWKKTSNNIWKVKLFVILSLLDNDKLQEISNKVTQIKNNSKTKWSRWYKYSVFIENYIKTIEWT